MATGQQMGSVLFGGLFIGIWFFLALFETDVTRDMDVGAWVLFGLIGLVVAGAIYATRVTTGTARVAIFAAIGVAIGMLATAFILNQLGEGLAALVTFVGALLIVTALPAPERPAGQPTLP